MPMFKTVFITVTTSSMDRTSRMFSQIRRRSISRPTDRKKTIIKMLWIGWVLSTRPWRRLLLPIAKPARNAP